MTIWDTAGATIDAAFADPEPLIFTGAGLVAAPLTVIRIETPAPDFEGKGATLRRIAFEVAQSLFPQAPTKHSCTGTHRGRAWSVTQVERIDDVSPRKYVLTVTDAGAAA